MITNEIIEGNKLIVAFMKETNNLSDIYYMPTFGKYENHYGIIEYVETFRIDELKYHSSWDWLIPVIYKIREFTLVVWEVQDVNHKLQTLNIKETWKSTVEFIKWYNNDKDNS